MAAVGDPPLQGLDPVLEGRHPGVRGQAVLEEVEATAGPEHPADLGQRRLHVGDRAQGERAQRGVAAGVVEGERLPVEADLLHRDRRGTDPAGRHPEGRRRRLHGQDPLDPVRVVGDVEARAEPDLDDPRR